MRAVFMLLSIIFFLELLFLPAGDAESAWDSFRDTAAISLGVTEIKLSGNNALRSDEVIKLLPPQKSNFWWYNNAPSVEAALKNHPLISEASIKRCSGMSWRCIEVDIKERRPSFAGLVNNSAWLIGDDGGF